jgi:hypothetical protein
MAEPIKAGSEAANNALSLGFRTIADIARERVRRVLRSEEHKADKIGVRAFRLTPSNIRGWTGIEERKSEVYLAQSRLEA